MPTITYKRLWCKTCNDFTLHSVTFGESALKCRDCKTEYSDILIKDIPKDKIQEQRERYKKREKERINNFIPYLLGSMNSEANMMIDMFRKPGSDIEIIESDAGQKYIDEQERKIRDEEYEKQRLIIEEQRKEALKYKHLGRNDKCLCGSGKKYKNCCLIRFQKCNL